MSWSTFTHEASTSLFVQAVWNRLHLMSLSDWKLAGSYGDAAGGRLASSAAAHFCWDRDL